jgi:tRNA threonylcarbamoyladenosine biosynthesis protein TsaE
MNVEWIEKVSQGPEDTFNLGKELSKLLKKDDIIGLTGSLGSGKTVIAQGICAGLDVVDPVTSPSFTIIQEYKGRMPVYHFDFYRLDSLEAIEDLDLDYYWEAGGVSIIEWVERGAALLPESHFLVSINWPGDEHVSSDRRLLRLTAPEDRGIKDLMS